MASDAIAYSSEGLKKVTKYVMFHLLLSLTQLPMNPLCILMWQYSLAQSNSSKNVINLDGSYGAVFHDWQ